MLRDTEHIRWIMKEYNDILPLHQGDIGHTKLPTMDIDAGNHPPFVQKHYTLPLQHPQWVQGKLIILEKAGITSQCIPMV